MILFWFNGFRRYSFIGLDHFISNVPKKCICFTKRRVFRITDWMYPPQNCYVEDLSPSVMMFEAVAFGQWVKLEEAMRAVPWSDISALKWNARREHVLSFSPCKDAVRREPCASQERGPHRTLTSLVLWSLTSSIQNREKSTSLFSHPVYDILWLQSEETKSSMKKGGLFSSKIW